MSDKAEYVLDICDEMVVGQIPKHRTDKELLTHYAERIKKAYFQKMCELADVAQFSKDKKDRPLSRGADEALDWLEAKIAAVKAELKELEEKP